MTIHPQARTTPRVRAEIQAAPATVTHTALARQLGINVLTVRKWRQRADTADRSHRPQQMHTRLNEAQEAVLMEVRRMLWLSLDDLLVVGREFLCAQLSRSALSRCMVRHGLNQRHGIKRVFLRAELQLETGVQCFAVTKSCFCGPLSACRPQRRPYEVRCQH